MQETNRVNGLNVPQMFQTIEAIKKQPTLARFQFRAENEWVGGTVNRSRIRRFYGAGHEDKSRTAPFVYVSDEPPVLLGGNEGANPGEFLLHALAGCITTTFIMHAAARGIRVEEISTSLEGNIDLQGFLDLDDSVTPGFDQIRIRMDIKADCSNEELDSLLAFAREHSAVTQSLCRPVPVIVERAASAAA